MNNWDDAERRVERAQELFEQRRWSEALNELRAATDINPYNAGWHFNTGLTLDEMERYAEAIDAYRRAMEIDGNDLVTRTHLGIDLRRIGHIEESIAVFNQIEVRDPSFEPAYCNRIAAYAELGDHDRAEEMFYLARLFKEQCPDCYHNLGISLFDREKYDKAIWCWRKVLDLDEAYPDIELRIAEAFWRKGEREAARQHFLIALRKDPGNTSTLLELGNLLTEMGRVEDAGEKFHRAIELAPEEPAGYFHHGQWLTRFGGQEGADDAMDLFRRALTLDPTYPGVHLRLAELHQRRGERSLARRHLRAELLLRPQDPKLLLELANLLMDSGLTRAAVSSLKRLVEIAPACVEGWQNLAVSQFMIDRYDDGMESCHKCLAIDAENVKVIYNLALAHERLRQYEHATHWVAHGLDLVPRDASLQKLELRIRLLRWKDWCARTIRALVFPTSTPVLRGLGHLRRFRQR